jgi:AcrR family transcriptional regulator
MDEIAAAAKLTKRTLYHHFESKDRLLAEVLAEQHELALRAFRTFGDRLSGSPEQIVTEMFRELGVWADRPRWAGSGFTRLVIELADLPGHPARKIARRHKALLEGCLADLLARSGIERSKELARAVWLLSEGAISLILVHGDRGYSAAASQAATMLVQQYLKGQLAALNILDVRFHRHLTRGGASASVGAIWRYGSSASFPDGVLLGRSAIMS